MPSRFPAASCGAVAGDERVDNPDPKAANAQALEESGKRRQRSRAGLLPAFCTGSQGFGIDTSADGLARILDGIYLDAGAPIELQLTREAKDVPTHVASILRQRGLDPAACICASASIRSA